MVKKSGLVSWVILEQTIGDTFEEVQENIKEAIELYLEVLQERGETIPEPTTKVGLVGVAAEGFKCVLAYHCQNSNLFFSFYVRSEPG